ncbi:MAG: alpha/beta hydrolase-fold protein, partial [Pseudomonadales bacterium]
MPLHTFSQPKGRLEFFETEAHPLLTNMLGDPISRTVGVYVPEVCRADERYPVLIDLAGFTGSGLSHLAWKGFGETLPQRIDRLMSAGVLGPAVYVFPDCFTSLGGNQYVDSFAMGQWATWLHEVLVPAVEARYPVIAEPGARGLFGKSSGGYGALHQALNHGEHWGAVVCHSGDMNFELCYGREFPEVLLALTQSGLNIAGYIERLHRRRRIAGGEMHVLMTLAMAASYDPDADAPFGVRLPVDLQTCEIDDARWAAWQAFDPIIALEAPEAQAKLRSLKGLFVD